MRVHVCGDDCFGGVDANGCVCNVDVRREICAEGVGFRVGGLRSDCCASGVEIVCGCAELRSEICAGDLRSDCCVVGLRRDC